MTITIPAVASDVLARVRMAAPNLFGGTQPFDPRPVDVPAPQVPHPLGLNAPGGPANVENPYKPFVNPAGHTLPSVAAPSRLGVPPSHLLGLAMRALAPRSPGTVGIVTHPQLLGPPIVATGAPTHLPVPLPTVGVLSGPVLPTVAKGTVPRWT